MSHDPDWIMAQLSRLLTAYEQTLRRSGSDQGDWLLTMCITYRASDGSRGITFSVGATPQPEQSEDV